MSRHAHTIRKGALLTAFVGLLAACESTPMEQLEIRQGPVPSLTVSPDFLVMEIGESFTLEAMWNGADARDWGGEVGWTSTDRDIVHVTEGGFVTARAIGEAFVMAEAGEGASGEALILVVGDRDQIPPHAYFRK